MPAVSQLTEERKMIHRSPALTAIYNEVKTSDRNHVLDLGPMSQGCFELFSSLSCRIKVEDIASYVAVNISENGRENINFDEYMQSYKKDEKFDVVLAWDILNYLDLNQINQLFEKIKPHCKANTLIYMLRYTRKYMPIVPRFFNVKDQYTIEMSEGQLAPRTLQSPSTLQLLSSMPGAYMQETIIEKMGMQPDVTEHVIRYSPTSDKKHLVSQSEAKFSEANVPSSANVQERIHTSPSIELISKIVTKHKDVAILDLGTSLGRQKDHLMNGSGRYYNADVFQAIQNARKKASGELNLSLLDFELSTKFDVILVWDIFNFCTPAQLVQLEKALSIHSHKNTLMLSYVYTGKFLPSKPNLFQVMDSSHVKISHSKRDQENKSSFTGATLLKSLSSFNLNKSFAYRAGMDREIIEYLFLCRETKQVTVKPKKQSV